MPSSEDEERGLQSDIGHCQQRFDWDCGLACVAMLIDDLDQRKTFLAAVDENKTEMGIQGTSLWTIDLAYLIKR